ncbi:MAG TPA: L,D-transpeptidase [Polyangiaceae bacterium]|nr:L,D-transpeptidase [Polyangiaceae bacterium]
MAKRPQHNADRESARARPSRPRHAPRSTPAAKPGGWGSWGAGFVLVAAAGAAFFGWSAGCKHEPPPGAVTSPTPAPLSSTLSYLAAADAGAAVSGPASGATEASKPYDGPLIGSMVSQAPIYAGMEAYRDKRIGYLRQGGKAPVDPSPNKSGNCEAGWYRLIGGGYICGKFATLDLNHPLVRLGIAAPNFDDVLPYRYAWNTTMGTPLYKSVPSREDMLQYEPYLRTAQAKRRARPAEAEAAALQTTDNPYGPDPNAISSAVGALGPPFITSDRRPWWLVDADGKPDIKLSDLTEDADAVVAKRMFKGFYVAIDRQFNWNNRNWYKTTAALVAPADRLSIREPPLFKGLELTGSDAVAPVAFILGTKAWKYEVDPDKRRATPTSPVERFTGVLLTGRVVPIGNTVFRETKEGWWMRTLDGTYTDPSAPPPGLGADEKWIDVNLTRQTLVAFEGDRPVYATLVSSGRRGRDPNDKVHDHQTVQGSFRIREKHVSITMDGDGPAPGDMPYSIEDVPYVMYFEGSYALHGAFWHNNFGHEQSHGCVNLAPLDAKRLFFWTEPLLPQGWHGAIAPKERPGTRVVVHE